MLLNDEQIKKKISDGLIKGAVSSFHTERVLSYGVGSFGYDVLLAKELLIMRKVPASIIDPKAHNDALWESARLYDESFFVMPPYSFALGCSKETFNLPRSITGVVFPKSTYARCGLICYQTVLEAGWKGKITLGFANNTPNPIKLYADEGCAQVLFFEGDDCKCSYADRKGKYQNQACITHAKVL